MKGLFDLEFHENKIKKYQPPLSKLNKIINWEIFRNTIETALYVKPKGAGGRPPYDRLLMFKILILQKYYNLSDEQTEFQINDRTSFRQFLNLEIGDKIPDEKTVWDFKNKLWVTYQDEFIRSGMISCVLTPDLKATWYITFIYITSIIVITFLDDVYCLCKFMWSFAFLFGKVCYLLLLHVLF